MATAIIIFNVKIIKRIFKSRFEYLKEINQNYNPDNFFSTDKKKKFSNKFR